MHTKFVYRTEQWLFGRATPRSTPHRNTACGNRDMQHAEAKVQIADPPSVLSSDAPPDCRLLRKWRTQQKQSSCPDQNAMAALIQVAEDLVQHALIALNALHELRVRARPQARLTNLPAHARRTDPLWLSAGQGHDVRVTFHIWLKNSPTPSFSK